MNHDGRLVRILRTDAAKVVALALVIGFGLQWKACIEPNRIDVDWRETAHWRAPSSQAFQPDDPLVRYQKFRAAPFGNVLYGILSRTGVDAGWGKLNGLVWFGGTALLLFYVARTMGPGRWAGWAAAVVFVLFPSRMELFAGGQMPGLSVALLGVTALVAFNGRWWWGPPLVLLQGLIEPTAAPHVALVLILAAVGGGDRNRRRLAPLALAVLACLIVLGTRSLGAPDELGTLVERSDVVGRAEFFSGGRGEILPTPSLRASISTHFGFLTFAATCLLAFLVLGKKMLSLPRGLWALFFANLGMLVAADVFLMHLGVPEDAMARGAPVFVALTTGVWVARMVSRESRARTIFDLPLLQLRASPAVLGVVLVALIGCWEHRGSFVPTGALGTRHFHRERLYEAVRALPEGTLLATHPRTASELPLMTGRSVVISSKLAQPWWSEHWARSEKRIHDILRAYYTGDPEVLLQVTRGYEIDYWVVDLKRYREESLPTGGMDYEPFASWARANLRGARSSVLPRIPPSYRSWSDRRNLFIVSAENLERFANDTRRRH